MEKVLTNQNPKTKMIQEFEIDLEKTEKELGKLEAKKKALGSEAKLAQKIAENLSVNPLDNEIKARIKERAENEAEIAGHAVGFIEREMLDKKFEIQYLQTKIATIKNPRFYW